MKLRTKLVLAITLLVTALVVGFSYVYLSQLVRSRIAEAANDGDFILHEIANSAHEVVANTDLADRRIDTEDPKQVLGALHEAIQEDPGMNSLMQSIVGYQNVVYDAMITDGADTVVLHTLPDLIGAKLPKRELYTDISQRRFIEQVKLIYGRGRTQPYEMRLPLQLGDLPFGEVRVSISAAFLRNELKPQLDRALIFSAIAILASMMLAAGFSTLALRPLKAISKRLDLITAGDIEAAKETGPIRRDEFGVVNTKIDRLGRQMRDVKEVFSALKENLDQLMANLQEGLILFTGDGRVVLVSASAEQIVGRPRAEILGNEIYDVFDRSTALGRLVIRAFQMREPIQQREVELERGGRLQVSLDFIQQGSDEIGALLTMRDTESVRKIESEIELSRRLAAIGRLTSGVAHEVKNPINAIVVHMEILREKLQKIDPDTQRHMDVIASEIHRLDRVVQTLVDFTRPVELKLTDTDLRRTVEDVIMLASPESEQRSVTVVSKLPAEPLPAKVDADLVKQALLNVVLNGVQAMPQGGTITVEARRIDGSAEIAVQDQGGGIPANIQDKIFNLYFTTKQKGSGIGLAMTYRVLQLHNGSIDFQTEEGRGTTFHLRFPLTDARQDEVQEASARS